MLKSDCRASLFLSLLIREEDKSMQKVAIYCRLSEEDKDKKCENIDSESIQNQKKMLCEYALEKGWEIYNIYSDDDYAGADRKRPQFNRLLEDTSIYITYRTRPPNGLISSYSLKARTQSRTKDQNTYKCE